MQQSTVVRRFFVLVGLSCSSTSKAFASERASERVHGETNDLARRREASMRLHVAMRAVER